MSRRRTPSATLDAEVRSPGPLPYGRQSIDDDDVAAVVEALRSDWLTTGPRVGAFEAAFAAFVRARHAVALANGTAALHAAMHALDLRPGDEVVVPAITFAATANAVVFCGGTPVFADVDPATLLVDAASLEARTTSRTRAIVAVDYAGQPCDYDALRELAARRGVRLMADACHALGATYRRRPVGSLAELSTFSFHPVKPITTGEGGMVTTEDRKLAARIRRFRNHGISSDHHQRAREGSWEYDMVELGFNYRLSDLHCALGLSQLRKLDRWVERRREIAGRYDAALSGLDGVAPLVRGPHRTHAYHLYVVRLEAKLARRRREIFQALRERGVGVNVHYRPVHLHSYYRQRFGTAPGLCPEAEAAYEEILTLPLFPGISDGQVDRVVAALGTVLAEHGAGARR